MKSAGNEKISSELTVRQRCAMVLRRFRMLQLADQFYFYYLLFRQRKNNKSFCNSNPSLAVPPMPILYDILGTCDIEGYFVSGREHASRIREIICENKHEKQLKILEWGCGPARVLQHLQAPPGQEWSLFGSDYNPRTIAWCRSNYKGIVFYSNNLAPPLDAGEERFDVIYCISVFTHLSEEMHFQWVKEIIRLLKPGGLFIGTFHGERYRNQLSEEEKARFDNGELVVRSKIYEGKKNYTAYHADIFLKKLLSPFSSCWFFEDPCFKQIVWCAIK